MKNLFKKIKFIFSILTFCLLSSSALGSSMEEHFLQMGDGIRTSNFEIDNIVWEILDRNFHGMECEDRNYFNCIRLEEPCAKQELIDLLKVSEDFSIRSGFLKGFFEFFERKNIHDFYERRNDYRNIKRAQYLELFFEQISNLIQDLLWEKENGLEIIARILKTAMWYTFESEYRFEDYALFEVLVKNMPTLSLNTKFCYNNEWTNLFILIAESEDPKYTELVHYYGGNIDLAIEILEERKKGVYPTTRIENTIEHLREIKGLRQTESKSSNPSIEPPSFEAVLFP